MHFVILITPTILLIIARAVQAQQHVVLTGVQTGIKNGARPYRRDIRDLRTDNTAW